MAKMKVTTLPDNHGKPLYVFLKYEDYLALAHPSNAAKPSRKSASAQTFPSPKNTVKLPDAVLKRLKSGNISLMRAWREHLGLSQSEVARRIGITQGGYTFIEKAKKPRAPTVSKVAAAFGISAAKLAV
ncbi:MAG: helix-turn-helix transcriptional regulator [Burkholderiales bacterium]|jgi:DNA-binding XRE family transcriptional regulator|nr:helix-turn-helix transcriptional regulator [Burkholderiales bacterium]